MSNADLKGALALADLIRDLALAQRTEGRNGWPQSSASSGAVKHVDRQRTLWPKSAATIASANCSLITKRSPKSSE